MSTRQNVTAIGWAWVGVGAWTLLAGAGAFLLSSLQGPPDFALPFRSSLLDFVFRYYRWGACIQAILGGFTLYTGLEFLDRERWTRPAIQVLSIVFFVWISFFCIAFLQAVPHMTPSSGLASSFSVVRVVITDSAIMPMWLFGFALGLCFFTLRRPAIRDEFERADQIA